MFARTMRGQWEALRSSHWLPMDIGGHVPPLRASLGMTKDLSRCMKPPATPPYSGLPRFALSWSGEALGEYQTSLGLA